MTHNLILDLGAGLRHYNDVIHFFLFVGVMGAWDVVANVANVEALSLAIITGISTHVCHTLTTAESELEWCKKELQDIKTRINELSPDRRERLRIAAERKQCTSLEALECELQSLLDVRCELAQRAEQSGFWERNIPGKFRLSQLRTDICELQDAILELRSDTNSTTTFHLKEDKARARVRSMTVDANTHATAQASTSGSTH